MNYRNARIPATDFLSSLTNSLNDLIASLKSFLNTISLSKEITYRRIFELELWLLDSILARQCQDRSDRGSTGER